MPRKFTSVFVLAVYIPPDVLSKHALHKLYDVITIHMTKQPDGIFSVTVDFIKHTSETVLLKFHLYVHLSTKGNKLENVYTNFPGSYKALPHSVFGLSDHIFLLLLPVYSQLI